jgi:hypothetical protein
MKAESRPKAAFFIQSNEHSRINPWMAEHFFFCQSATQRTLHPVTIQ